MSDKIDEKDLMQIPLICPGYQIRVAERLVTRFYNGCFKDVGLSAVQFGLLVGIEMSDRPMVADLAEKSGADPSTLARNLKLLESTGLVLSVGGRGRFGKRFELSEQGRATLRKAYDLWKEAYQTIIADVGLPQIEQGLVFLSALEKSARKRVGQTLEPEERV